MSHRKKASHSDVLVDLFIYCMILQSMFFICAAALYMEAYFWD